LNLASETCNFTVDVVVCFNLWTPELHKNTARKTN
jgi:hypothetical protein